MQSGNMIGNYAMIAVLVGGCLLVGCEKQRSAPKNFQEYREDLPLSESYDITYRYKINSREKAKIHAPHLLKEPRDKKDPITVADSGVKIRFFDEQGELKSRMTADRARLKPDKGYAKAMGNVVVINNKGDTLNTEKLIWNNKKDRIYTDAFVKIHTPKEIILGDSLRAASDFSWYKIYKIRGTISLKE
jgi:LPS export ABC transporter protein LptC